MSNGRRRIDANHIGIAISGGNIPQHDYLSRAVLIMDNIKSEEMAISQVNRGSPSDAIPSIEFVQSMTEPGYSNFEDGYTRLDDGTLYVACRTDLGEVTGDMFDWWFANVDDTTRYRWWHPVDHIVGNWDPTFYAVQSKDRKKGHYVGHVHIVEEKVNKVKQRLHIKFMDPSRFFDVNNFPQQGITACLVARIHAYDFPFGYVAAGYLVHMVRKIPNSNNSELRSRFWLGENIFKDHEGYQYISSSIINFMGKQSWFKKVKLSESMAAGLYIHCHEEMTCLREFLPSFYEYETAKYATAF